jgi:L-alanine-DL-glutamate epimerase-like enolase superfamily enzyme
LSISLEIGIGAIKGDLCPEYFSEIRDPLTPILIEKPSEIEKGWVTISDASGFGLNFNEEVVNKYKVDY